MYLIVTGFLLLFSFPAFMLMGTGNLVVICLVVVVGVMVAGEATVGVQAAYFPELFGSRYRYAGVALGREFSAVFGGGIAPFICAALVKWATGSWWPVAVYMTVIMAISFGATLFAPETLDRDLLCEQDAT
jgi:MFS family permease